LNGWPQHCAAASKSSAEENPVSELRELYQSTILDHNKKPRNFRSPQQANRRAVGHNPLCGDEITVYLQLQDDIVADVCFQGSGCAISTASASMMTQAVKGRPLEEALQLFDSFQRMVTGESGADAADAQPKQMGKLAAFAGVREYPMRVKCATLAWHTLRAAAIGGEAATTE